MCNLFVSRLVIEIPPIPYGNRPIGKHFLTINSHLDIFTYRLPTSVFYIN